MVHLVRYISAAALVTAASAVPMKLRDSVVNEGAVSAPNGVLISDTPTATSLVASTVAPPMATSMAMASMMAPMASAMTMSSIPPMASSSMMMESSSAMMASSMMVDSASMAMMASQTMSASVPQMTYGSGSKSWSGSDGYNSCVQQCAASNPSPPMMWTPPATQSSASMDSSVGNGVTHTVIVAPTQGVLRYIPFSTNASVGDTVEFLWGAGPHTVTQSSALEVCNKTSAPGAFASGIQNKTFVFSQVVKDQKPVWFYCGIPTHCEKGMFGGVNIGQPDPTGSSSEYMPLSSVMSNLTMMSPQMNAAWAYTKSQTGSNAVANSWGMSTNCAGMSTDAMMQVASNALYGQLVMAANPTMGSSIVPTSNMTIPMDMVAQLFASSSSNATMSMASGASASPAASSVVPAAASTTPKSNGAGSITSSSMVVGLVAVIATFSML